MKHEKAFRPDRIGSYFRVEWLPLALVTLSGLIYNIGLLATPWFEGRLAQCLADILGGNATAGKMAVLVLAYSLVTLGVQAAACRFPGSSRASGNDKVLLHKVSRRRTVRRG